jgi:hypothetical protein
VNPDLPPEYLANWNQKDKAQRGETAATSLILLSLVPTKDGPKAAAFFVGTIYCNRIRFLLKERENIRDLREANRTTFEQSAMQSTSLMQFSSSS